MTCLAGHERVVAWGRCARCRQPLQAVGPLLDAGAEPRWLATPFLGALDAICRVTRAEHRVIDGTGTCCCCSTEVGAVSDDRGRVSWWWE